MNILCVSLLLASVISLKFHQRCEISRIYDDKFKFQTHATTQTFGGEEQRQPKKNCAEISCFSSTSTNFAFHRNEISYKVAAHIQNFDSRADKKCI